MNSTERKSRLGVTVRGIVLIFTCFLICLSVSIMAIELSAISSLKSQLAEIETSRERIRAQSRDVKELEQKYKKKRSEAFYHERHITELIQACRNIGDMPKLNSEFIVCEEPKNDPFSSERWIYVPEGKHELQVLLSEYEGNSPKGTQLFSYALLPKSAYKLDFRFLRTASGLNPAPEPVPIELSIESNNPDYKTIRETLPVSFYPSLALRTFYSSHVTPLSLRFPGECFGLKESLNDHSNLEVNLDARRKASQLARFAWTWQPSSQLANPNQAVSKRMVVNIEVLSDASPCAAPFYSTDPKINAKFRPYSGNGRYFPVDSQ